MRLFLAGIALIVGGLSPIQAEWLSFRGNTVQTGVSDATLPEKLAVRWEFKTKDAIEGTPVVAKGVVYVGSYDQHLYAIDLKTGREKWKTKLGPIKAPSALREDRIYVGDVDGKFYCVNATNGDVVWKFEADGEISAGANFAGENILISSHDCTLYCLSPQGKKVWEFKTEGPIYGSVPVIKDKTYVAGCDSHLHVIDIKTGKSSGSLDLEGQTGAAAAIFEDKLYVGTMSNQVLAINLATLKVEWRFEAPKRKQAFNASAAVNQDYVVIGSRDSKVYALDRKTGNARWDFLTERKVDGSAVISGNRIFVGSQDEKFYVLDLKKGTKLQEFEVDSGILGSPAVSDGVVLFGTEKGTLYCLGAP